MLGHFSIRAGWGALCVSDRIVSVNGQPVERGRGKNRLAGDIMRRLTPNRFDISLMSGLVNHGYNQPVGKKPADCRRRTGARAAVTGRDRFVEIRLPVNTEPEVGARLAPSEEK